MRVGEIWQQRKNGKRVEITNWDDKNIYFIFIDYIDGSYNSPRPNFFYWYKKEYVYESR